MFDMQNMPSPAEKQYVENLKISELTVSQFRQVMQECFNADRSYAVNREMAQRQALGIREPGRPVW